MIQLTWFELLLLLFSVAISGCLIYGFFLTPISSREKNQNINDDDLIDPASKKRLMSYDEQEKQVVSGVMNPTQENNSILQKMDELELQLEQLQNTITQRPTTTTASPTNDHLRVLSDSENDAFIQAKEAFELTIYKAEQQLEKLEEACRQTEHEKAQELLKEIQARKITIRRLNGAFRQNCFSLEELIETKEELQTDLDQLIAEASFLKRA